MNESIRYVGKRIGTEIVVSTLMLAITSGAKSLVEKYYRNKTQKKLEESLADS